MLNQPSSDPSLNAAMEQAHRLYKLAEAGDAAGIIRELGGDPTDCPIHLLPVGDGGCPDCLDIERQDKERLQYLRRVGKLMRQHRREQWRANAIESLHTTWPEVGVLTVLVIGPLSILGLLLWAASLIHHH